MRVQGGEFYSPFGDLEYRIATPTDWPQDASIGSDDPANMPPIDLIAPHIRLFADPHMKELLITPRGVRIVYQVQQAERIYYTVLRQIEFAEDKLAASLCRELPRRNSTVHSTPLPHSGCACCTTPSRSRLSY